MLVDFVAAFTPSGWLIVSILSLTPLTYGRCRSLGDGLGFHGGVGWCWSAS